WETRDFVLDERKRFAYYDTQRRNWSRQETKRREHEAARLSADVADKPLPKGSSTADFWAPLSKHRHLFTRLVAVYLVRETIDYPQSRPWMIEVYAADLGPSGLDRALLRQYVGEKKDHSRKALNAELSALRKDLVERGIYPGDEDGWPLLWGL